MVADEGMSYVCSSLLTVIYRERTGGEGEKDERERREEKWDRIGGGKKNHALLRPVNLDFMDNLPVINSVTQGKT